MPDKWRNRIVEYRPDCPVGELMDNAKNWRIHPRAQEAGLAGVLGKIGKVDVLKAYISERYGGLTLFDGHLRKHIAPDETWPVVICDLTDEEADLVIATLDPLSAMAEADAAQVQVLLGGLGQQDEAIQAILKNLETKMPTVTEPRAKKKSLEDEKDELPGVQQLRQWAIFESDLPYGLPALRPDMLLSVPFTLQTWAGPRYAYADSTPFLYIWGSDTIVGLDLSNTIVGFYTDDYRFENFWLYPDKYTAKLLNAGVPGVIQPNFSMWWEHPPIVRMWQRYRSLWVARYLQEAGISVIPDIQLSPEDGDLCWVGVPVGSHVAIQFHTKLDEEKWGKKLAFLHVVLEALRPERLLVYADKPGWERVSAEADLPALTWCASRVMVRRGHMDRVATEKL